MPIDPFDPVQISEIYDTVTDQTDGHGYLGYIITYPNGRIVNKFLEYKRHNHEQIHTKIERMRAFALSYYRSRG